MEVVLGRGRSVALTLAYPFLLFLSLSAPCIASSLVQIVGASSLASNRRFIFLILLFLLSLLFYIPDIPGRNHKGESFYGIGFHCQDL